MYERRTLHSLATEAGIAVYNPENTWIGSTTGYTAQARNGVCIGSIEIGFGGADSAWISGYGVLVHGLGIKWTELGPENDPLFGVRRV